MTIRDKLTEGRLIFDGALGTQLQAMGLPGGDFPESWNRHHSAAVKALHRAYIKAGSQIINTNTFGANRFHFPDEKVRHDLIKRGVSLALEARGEAGLSSDTVSVALDIGPTGRLIKPLGDLDFEMAVETFADMVRTGIEAGADLILCETFTDLYEAKAAVIAAKENSNVPLVVSFVFDETGKLMTGATPTAAAVLMEAMGVDAIGINCGSGPRALIPMIREILAVSSLPVIVTPNAGLPSVIDGKTVYSMTADEFAGEMADILKLGVHGIGGCCGTTADFIDAMVRRCREIPISPLETKSQTWVTSGSRTVEIGPKPIIIGERINPTGKKKLQQALKNADFSYIQEQAIAQEQAGASILDINVGMPCIDETVLLPQVVSCVQDVCALPLQIDTSSAQALEAALRLYNGKAMVNSVSADNEALAEILPIVSKYGGVLVGLPLNKAGIPSDAGGRLALIGGIYEAAEWYHFPRKDLVMDGLTMTVSADSKAASVTLETIRKIRQIYGGHTILGISNVSFGLPRRELINAQFLSMALGEGLSCAIINPQNAAVMNAWHTFMALKGYDSAWETYRDRYETVSESPVQAWPSFEELTRLPKPDVADASHLTLADCLENGLEVQAVDLTKQALEGGKAPLAIVNEELIPSLNKIGQLYQSGDIFLPQLLTSAAAAQAAFDVIKASMDGRVRAYQGRLALATVYGDIHDIGKNIVKVLLENYGFEVIDLGSNVPAETIVACIKDNGLTMVGLSAMMTTTVISMEETIRRIKAACPTCQVIVGGAVMSAHFAKAIQADYFAADAMETVRIAEMLGRKNKENL